MKPISADLNSYTTNSTTDKTLSYITALQKMNTCLLSLTMQRQETYLVSQAICRFI